MEPIKFEFITNEEIEKELSKVKLSIKGVGDESYISFKRLLNSSHDAFNGLNLSVKKHATVLNTLIQDIKQNEMAQKALFVQWEKGIISSEAYAATQAKQSIRLSELKCKVIELEYEIKQEIQLNKDATNALQQKIVQVSNLKEEYTKLSSEEKANEQTSNQLIKRIQELDNQIESINYNLQTTNENSSGFAGGFSQVFNSITEGTSKLQDFISIGKTLLSLGLDKFTLGLASSFVILKTALDGSSKGTEWLNSKIEYFKSIWNNSKQILTEGTAALYNIATGDFNSAKKNLETATKLNALQSIHANLSEQAYLNQCEINKKENDNFAQIQINISEILKYNNELLNTNKTLEEKKTIVDKILKLEKKNSSLKMKTVNDNFANFHISNKLGLDSISELFPEQIKLAEEYFATMSKGGELTSDQQRTLMKAITDITNNLDRPWDDNQKKQFRSFFDDAIKITTEYHDKCRKINEQLNSSQRTEAIITTNQNKKTSLESLQEEVRQRKEQYAALGEYERNLGKEQAEQDFQGLKSQGEDFIAYLNGKINGIQSKPNPTKEDRMNLSFLMTTRDELAPKPDISAFKETIEEKKQYYKEDLDGYIKYLQDKRKLTEDDNSAEGTQKRIVLDTEIGNAQKQQKNELDNLLKQYQTYTVKMASLQADYEKDDKLLQNARNNVKQGEDVSRIDDTIIARKNSYNQSLAELQAENSEFSQVLFGNLEKISNSSLNKAINEARAFIANLRKEGNITPEMESFLKNIENGIDTAEKKKASRLPEDLMDGANALQECANLANVFDGELGDVLQTAANVAKGATDIAEGIAQFSTNPLQGATSILSGITGIIGGIGSRLKENQKIREEYQQGLLETYSKELEYNSILRDRLRTQQQIGETTLQYSQRLQKELTAQKGSIDQEYQQVWGKLMNEQYVSGTGYKHGTWFRKAKTWNEYSSLSGKSYKQIEGLYTQDKLDGAAKTLFERLKALKEEGANIVEMMDQLNEQMRENWTSTTATAISDSIVQGFLDGKKSAADFAADFEGLMRTAMLQSVKMKYLDAPLRDWYERFAAESENGLSQGKIEELRKAYDQIIESAAKEAENIEKITGISMGADEQAREASAKGIQSISQESADQLLGTANTLTYITSNIDKNVTSIHSLMIDAARQWVQIAYNTSYCVKLETMEQDLKAMRMTVQGMSDNGILMRSR